MSLNSFKESLKSTISASTSSSPRKLPPRSQTSILSSTQESSLTPRKPPKSSILQQLQRCSASPDFTSSHVLPLLPHRTPDEDGNSATEKEEEKKINDSLAEDEDNSRIVSSDLFSGAVRGPFEPLVLSSPGEFPVIQVPAKINCRLLDHQREGVKFLYGLYEKNHGGVLGDDMGLGKTIQTIALLVAVAAKNPRNGDDRESVTPFLIICPTSVIQNWENEFNEWSDLKVAIYHGLNRDSIFRKLESSGLNALITSFDTFRIHGSILSMIQWHIVIFDEAHRLKNEKSQLYKACSQINTRRRFGLTGTIMQNKIMELFNLLDFLTPGSLGTREHFRDFYNEPLKHGQRISAPKRFVEISEERRQQLSLVLEKYLLRRTKEDTISHLMVGKEDNVVFCSMSDLQKRVYKRMLELPEIQSLVNKDLPCSCGSTLAQIECCHRIIPHGIIWSHLHKDRTEGCESCPFCCVLPCLVKLQQISNHLELIKPNPRDEAEKQKKDAELASVVFGEDINLVGGSGHTESFMGLSDMEHCGKMRALDKLLSSWISSGDKVLLFSYSVRMLDILEKFLIRKGYSFLRLDGSTPMSLRQSQVDDFNRSPSRQVFLISTKAGGLGLNLVSANRVVIFDPNWNPSQDLQAQDRSFRFGQKRHVLVFRLLSASSLEELIYTRQVYKQQLSNIAVSGKTERRYFEGVQDCKEFKGELFGICNLFRDLSDKVFTSEIVEKNGGKSFCLGKSEGMQDLGIVYAHRNEDIVNAAGSGAKDENQMRGIVIGSEKLSSERNITRGQREEVSDESQTEGVFWREKPSRESKGIAKSRGNVSKNIFEEESSSRSEKISRERKSKRAEYELIAARRGMEVVEFSRWVLAASSSDLQEVLIEYYHNTKKKKKKKMEVGNQGRERERVVDICVNSF